MLCPPLLHIDVMVVKDSFGESADLADVVVDHPLRTCLITDVHLPTSAAHIGVAEQMIKLTVPCAHMLLCPRQTYIIVIGTVHRVHCVKLRRKSKAQTT